MIVNDVGYGYGSEVVFKDLECDATECTGEDGTIPIEAGKIPTTVRVEIPLDRKKLAPGEHVPAELSIIATDATMTTPVEVTVKEGTTNTLVVDTAIPEPPASTTDTLN